MPMRPVEGLPGGLWKPAGGLRRPGGLLVVYWLTMGSCRTIGIQAGQLEAYWMPVTYWRTMEASCDGGLLEAYGGIWRQMKARWRPTGGLWRPSEGFCGPFGGLSRPNGGLLRAGYWVVLRPAGGHWRPTGGPWEPLEDYGGL